MHGSTTNVFGRSAVLNKNFHRPYTPNTSKPRTQNFLARCYLLEMHVYLPLPSYFDTSVWPFCRVSGTESDAVSNKVIYVKVLDPLDHQKYAIKPAEWPICRFTAATAKTPPTLLERLTGMGIFFLR